ncbi:MAG: YciI-like protein [Bacteriovoracaceae bacterium]|nr:YciI-like protein [Bacteroidota bacterium]
MKYYALIYHVAEDYITRRTQFREEHLHLANEAAQRGDLILGGALRDPYDTALLIFRVTDTSAIERFVHDDPYHKNGLVLSYEVREWNVVVGIDKK